MPLRCVLLVLAAVGTKADTQPGWTSPIIPKDINIGHATLSKQSFIRRHGEGDEALTIDSAAHVKRDVDASPAVFSSHDCQGPMALVDEGGGNDQVRNITCRFQNVCYDLAADTKTLLYFAPSTDTSERDKMTSINLRPLSMTCNTAVKLKVQVVNGPVPAGAATWKHATTVLFQPFGSENFGHEMGDDMYAVYVMQQLNHVADPYNSQLLTLEGCDRPEMDGANRHSCIGMMAKLYPAISRNPVLQLRAADLLKAYGAPVGFAQNKQKLMCFPLLIAGAGAHSFRSKTVQGQSHTFFSYRSFLMNNLLPACANGACGPTVSQRKTILIMQKSVFNPSGTGAGISNTLQLQDRLKKSFPQHDVELVDLAKLAFKDQVSLVARTTVMISHCGGGSFSALFLPPGATLVVVSKDPSAQPWNNFEMRFWQGLHWLTFHNVKGDLTPDMAEQITKRALQPTAQLAEQRGGWFSWLPR